MHSMAPRLHLVKATLYSWYGTVILEIGWPAPIQYLIYGLTPKVLAPIIFWPIRVKVSEE
jgi:hypothetical protein